MSGKQRIRKKQFEGIVQTLDAVVSQKEWEDFIAGEKTLRFRPILMWQWKSAQMPNRPVICTLPWRKAQMRTL